MQQLKLKLGLAVSMLWIASIACSFSFSSAKVENLRLASDEQGISVLTTFGQEDTFYLLGELANAPDDTQLKATWIAVEVENSPANTVIDEASLETGSGAFTFFLENNAPLWPVGKYQVDLYLNDELNQSLAFQVEQTVQAEMRDLRLAADESGSQPTTTFNPQDTWHLAGELINSPQEALIKLVWNAVDVSGQLQEGVIDEQEQAVGAGSFVIPVKAARADWPVGDYSVDVFLNGNKIQTLPFQVAGGPEASAQNVRMAADDAGTAPTTVFGPQDVFYLVADIQNTPPEGAAIKVVWTALQVEGGAEPNQEIDTYEGAVFDGVFWSSLTSETGFWNAGSYQVELFLNDLSVAKLAFAVTADGAAPVTQGETSMDAVYLALDNEGEQNTNVFKPADTFYLVGELLNAPQGAQVEADWIAEEVTGYDPGEVISEPEVFQLDEGSFSISLTSDSGQWALGTYRVETRLNGAPAETRYFSVSDIQVIDPYMATDDTGDKRTAVYGALQQFFLHFTLGNAPAGTKISTHWYYLPADGSESQSLNEGDYTFATGDYYVQLSSKDGAWTVGDYVVDIYLNDYYYISVYFEVQ